MITRINIATISTKLEVCWHFSRLQIQQARGMLHKNIFEQ